MKNKLVNLIIGIIALGLTLVFAELVYRALLFHGPSCLENLRDPGLYAEGDSNDDYWKLRVAFGGTPARRNDPLLGHIKSDIMPNTYSHANAGEIGSRTPVLLYGDSFAGCAVRGEDCFEGILNSNREFSAKYYLINYGVGSYGLDQIYLLYEKTIGLYDNPIVVFSLLDADIDRCLLTMREGQKPYFTMINGQLALRGLPIETDQRKFFADRPVAITSYLWRLVMFRMFPGSNDANSPSDPERSEKKKLAEAILLKVSRDLDARGLKHVFLVFEGLHRTWKPINWRIVFLNELFSKHEMPRIWARKAIERSCAAKDFDHRKYIVSIADPHPNRLANTIVSERIIEWLMSGRTD